MEPMSVDALGGKVKLTSANVPTFQPRLLMIGLTWLAIFSSRGLVLAVIILYQRRPHLASSDLGRLGRCSNRPMSDMAATVNQVWRTSGGSSLSRRLSDTSRTALLCFSSLRRTVIAIPKHSCRSLQKVSQFDASSWKNGRPPISKHLAAVPEI